MERIELLTQLSSYYKCLNFYINRILMAIVFFLRTGVTHELIHNLGLQEVLAMIYFL